MRFKGMRVAAFVLALSVLAVAAATAGPALAGKGGIKGGPGGGGGQTGGGSAVVVASPNPAPSQSYYDIAGSGFYPNQNIYVTSDCGASFDLRADAAGNMTDRGWAGTPKTCTFWYSQSNGRRLDLMATLNLVIQ